ncbi:BQ2448_5309 [Microbotryum intermedium]|uniref:BQ2448_5309 protein n=1 Tax=Microbotryum intermedium TaxID=269621 RepID=A0A238F945_9BASI|nr:BQ2448_5309 [Microbotryum intermedium]
MSPTTIDHLPVELLRTILSMLRYSASRWRAVAQALLMQDIHIDRSVAARRLIKSGMLERHQQGVRSLRLGSIGGCKTWVNYIRIILVEMTQKLHHLELVGLQGIDQDWFKSLRSLRLRTCTFDGTPDSVSGRLPPAADLPNLESLTLEQENDWAFVLPPCQAPKLESLALIHSRAITELVVSNLVFDYHRQLTKLSIEIEFAVCIIEPIIRMVTHCCEHLKELHLELHLHLDESFFRPSPGVLFRTELIQRVVTSVQQSKLQVEALCLTGWAEGTRPCNIDQFMPILYKPSNPTKPAIKVTENHLCIKEYEWTQGKVGCKIQLA